MKVWALKGRQAGRERAVFWESAQPVPEYVRLRERCHNLSTKESAWIRARSTIDQDSFLITQVRAESG